MTDSPEITPERISLHAPPASMTVVPERYWTAGMTLETFVDEAVQNRDFWQATMRLATVSEDALARARAIPYPRRVLVLLEDWCGDAVNTTPVIQRLVDANPLLALRVLRRDEHDALMDAHLSGSARAIPVAIVMDETGRHLGWWGSRPSPLQHWRLVEGNALEKSERYKATRTWYARDRGRTTIEEILTLLEAR